MVNRKYGMNQMIDHCDRHYLVVIGLIHSVMDEQSVYGRYQREVSVTEAEIPPAMAADIQSGLRQFAH